MRGLGLIGSARATLCTLIVMVGEGPPSMSSSPGLGTRRGWRAFAHHDGIKQHRPD
jgi:hypothetical protein